ncbi:MAG TPA: peptidylprolyl isomerase [Candidatus Limnocylindria bacterium]|nr:peptidylprolyl isomerase [Candidatus Limnocylindria bacterium]
MRGVRGAALALVVVGVVAARGEVVNRIVATIDGEPITAFELAGYRAQLGDRPATDQQILEAIITERLLEKEAAARGIKAAPGDVEAYIKEIRERGKVDDEAFAAALAQQGLTPETYRERVAKELVKSQLLAREIRGRVSVTDEEVERYYEAHREEYRTGGGVTVRDIFLAIPPGADEAEIERLRARALELREQARSRRAFTRLAAEHSQLPGRQDGGLLGTFKKGEMADELDRVVFSLEPGEVSEPVQTADGFHVLRVDEVVDAEYRPLDDELREEIREKLYGEALEQRYQDWLKRDLRERHQVEVLQ